MTRSWSWRMKTARVIPPVLISFNCTAFLFGLLPFPSKSATKTCILSSCCLQLLSVKSTWLSPRYEVFNIKTKNRKDKEGKERDGKPETPELNKKLIRNNIKFKIKNLLNTYPPYFFSSSTNMKLMVGRYPHLNFYGSIKDFQLQRLQSVPDVLLSVENADLRRRFQEYDSLK